MAESKDGGGTAPNMTTIKRKRTDELTDSDDILDWVAAFTGDEKFVTTIDGFVEAHASKFEGLEDGAFTLEHTELFNKFLALAEGKLEEFLEAKGVPVTDFYRRCREAVEAAEKAGTTTSQALFVDLLLACSEFETFASMMGKAAARTAKAREALRAVCGHLTDFMDDEDNVAKVDEDDLEDVRGVVEGISKWLSNNESALMGDYLLKQFELEAQLLPVLYKYLGVKAEGCIRGLFQL